MKKLNLFLVAIFMIAFVGCQMNSETPLEFDETVWVKVDDTYHTHPTIARSVSSPLEEHTWDDGIVTVEPTTTEVGKKEYTCKLCNHNVTKDIEKLPPTDTNANGNEETTQIEETTQTEEPKSDDTDNGNEQTPPLEECKHEHKEETVTVPSTCTVKGKKTVTCKNCNEVVGETELDLAKHDYTVFVETIEPTVNARGYDLYKCSRCEEKEKRNFKDYVPTIEKYGYIEEDDSLVVYINGIPKTLYNPIIVGVSRVFILDNNYEVAYNLNTKTIQIYCVD